MNQALTYVYGVLTFFVLFAAFLSAIRLVFLWKIYSNETGIKNEQEKTLQKTIASASFSLAIVIIILLYR